MKKGSLNKVAGYRVMLGFTQKEMAKNLHIKTQQQYNLKENGKSSFSDEEKQLFKMLLVPYFKDITIGQIFFDE